MRRIASGITCFFFATFLLTGCTSLWQGLGMSKHRGGVSSSLVDYLYPGGETPPDFDSTIPNLELPLRVGLAFVPSHQTQTPGLSEAHKSALLGTVKDAFSDREYIREITVIPETYLRSKRGFDSVDQVARLYGLDVIALVSYDQMVYSDDTTASILYWTIVGAYFVKGSKNDVQTFVDTAIFDVRSHKLLFRAPGTDKIEATSTLIKSTEDLRKNRELGFSNAVADMTTNLEKELDVFRERIKTDKSVTISHRDGYSGGMGSIDPLAILFMALALAARHIQRRRA